ncbi:hypothetical protein INT45_014192, partial [Circinella minor]
MTEYNDNDNNNDPILTAVDIVDQQQKLEKEAQQVLPGKFEKCTFDQGYIRQALYSCKTCYPEEKDLAGFCYSCSIACHADHELFELFPKRHFRCDCGLVKKRGDTPFSFCCTLNDNKEPNLENKYNHNFRGRYCRCDKDYDPDQEDGTMYQCVICEDWFHDRCIGEIPSELEDFESYFCFDCTKKHSFLIQNPNHWISLGISNGNEKIHQWMTTHSTTGQKRKLDQIDMDDTIHDNHEMNKKSKEEPTDVLKQSSSLCKREETFEPEEDEDAGKSLMDVGMEHMMRMDRVQAMESIMAYTTLSSQIKDFLQKFKESGEIVTEAHIRQFFAEKRLQQ